MNDRIDELMIQAEARHDSWGLLELDDFQYRKFAKLIINECCFVMLRDGKSVSDSTPTATRDNYVEVAIQNGMVEAAVRYAKTIKNNFGLE